MGKKTKQAILWGVTMGVLFLILRAAIQNTPVSFGLCLIFLGMILLVNQAMTEPAAETAPSAPAAKPPAAAQRPFQQKQELEQGQDTVQKVWQLTCSLKDETARKESEDCVGLCNELLKAAAENEAAQSHLANFFRHYLPMFQQMLESYVKCEAAEVLPEATTKEFLQFLDTMESALKQLKENVYIKEVDQLAIDMDVLETLYRSDGLLDDGLLNNGKEDAAHGTI